MPLLWSSSISARRPFGSTTTPLPIMQFVLGKRMPDGTRRNENSPCSCTTLCPALLPPWYLTTKSACIDNSSTIFPLPSSPHCAPMIASTVIGWCPFSIWKLLCWMPMTCYITNVAESNLFQLLELESDKHSLKVLGIHGIELGVKRL